MSPDPNLNTYCGVSWHRSRRDFRAAFRISYSSADKMSRNAGRWRAASRRLYAGRAHSQSLQRAFAFRIQIQFLYKTWQIVFEEETPMAERVAAKVSQHGAITITRTTGAPAITCEYAKPRGSGEYGAPRASARNSARTAVADIGRIIELTRLHGCCAVVSHLASSHASARHERRSGRGSGITVARITIPIIVRVSITIGVIIEIAVIPRAQAIA